MKAKFLEDKSPWHQATLSQFALSKICQRSVISLQRKFKTPQVPSPLVDGPDNGQTLAFSGGVALPCRLVYDWRRELEVADHRSSEYPNACRAFTVNGLDESASFSTASLASTACTFTENGFYKSASFSTASLARTACTFTVNDFYKSANFSTASLDSTGCTFTSAS